MRPPCFSEMLLWDSSGSVWGGGDRGGGRCASTGHDGSEGRGALVWPEEGWPGVLGWSPGQALTAQMWWARGGGVRVTTVLMSRGSRRGVPCTQVKCTEPGPRVAVPLSRP